MKYVFPTALVLVSLALSGWFVYIATFRSPTPTEGTLFQVFILLAGLGGSWWFGRQSGVNRSHARSAFRRVLQLYKSLSRVSEIVQTIPSSGTNEDYRLALARIDSAVKEQIVTADDALEDWRDIVPRDVRELRARGYLVGDIDPADGGMKENE